MRFESRFACVLRPAGRSAGRPDAGPAGQATVEVEEAPAHWTAAQLEGLAGPGRGPARGSARKRFPHSLPRQAPTQPCWPMRPRTLRPTPWPRPGLVARPVRQPERRRPFHRPHSSPACSAASPHLAALAHQPRTICPAAVALASPAMRRRGSGRAGHLARALAPPPLPRTPTPTAVRGWRRWPTRWRAAMATAPPAPIPPTTWPWAAPPAPPAKPAFPTA